MFNTIKPYVGPVILVLAQRGADMTNYQNDLVSGILLGVALFWLVLAIFSNRALLRKLPGILDWVPFLDPTGGFSTAAQLTGKFINDQTFNISVIVHEGMIKNRTFEDCVIFGPAILVLDGVGYLHECGFDGPHSFIEVKQGPVGGVIHVVDSSFRRCVFVRIGFLGPKEAIDRFKQGIADNAG